jgi:hypothetical protein
MNSRKGKLNFGATKSSRKRSGGTHVADKARSRVIKFTSPSKLTPTLKHAVFCDVTPCASCKSRRFEGTYRIHHQNDKSRRARNISSN